jgi:hypothetical protein
MGWLEAGVAAQYAQPPQRCELSCVRLLASIDAQASFAVDQPVQELGVIRATPIIVLALRNVTVEVIDCPDPIRREARDLGKSLDIGSGQANLVSEANHRLSPVTAG